MIAASALTRRHLLGLAAVAAVIPPPALAGADPWQGIGTLGLIEADAGLLPAALLPASLRLVPFPAAGSLLDHFTARIGQLDAALLPPAFVPEGAEGMPLDLGPAPAAVLARHPAGEGLPIGSTPAEAVISADAVVLHLPEAMLLPNLAAGLIGAAILPASLAQAARTLGFDLSPLPPARLRRVFVRRSPAMVEGAIS